MMKTEIMRVIKWDRIGAVIIEKFDDVKKIIPQITGCLTLYWLKIPFTQKDRNILLMPEFYPNVSGNIIPETL